MKTYHIDFTVTDGVGAKIAEAAKRAGLSENEFMDILLATGADRLVIERLDSIGRMIGSADGDCQLPEVNEEDISQECVGRRRGR